MMYYIYNALLFLACPLGAVWLAGHPRYRPLLGRFRPEVPQFSEPPLWVHACSVGEVSVAKAVLDAAAYRWPDVPRLLTVSTVSGRESAGRLCPEHAHTWLPFDLMPIARRFVSRAQPRALVLIETEIWPSVIRETHRAGCPVLLMNGRISDKHFGRYLRYASVFRPVIRSLSSAGMQSEEYADRLIRLGAPRERVHVTGNTKFDGVREQLEPGEKDALRAEMGIPEGAPIVVFGSTRPGDEALAARCWRALRGEFPELRFVIAPRHLERVGEALAPFGDDARLRSQSGDMNRRVTILDTHGELVTLYGLATVAVIGGSFYPGVEGHNPLEPAALGVTTLFGPYMRNFVEPAEILCAARGAQRVEEAGDLPTCLRRLLNDREARDALAERGRRAVLENRGALQRNLDLLAPYLD